MENYVKILEGYQKHVSGKSNKRWSVENLQKLGLPALAKELQLQTEKIRLAQLAGDTELAIAETEKGSEIIKQIAARINGPEKKA